MDFDPNHKKWECCCCRLPTGLKILGVVEVLIGCAVTALLVLLVISDQKVMHPWTVYVAITICVAVIVSSALLVVGIKINKEHLLYPTLAVKTVCILAVHCLVIYNVMQPYHVEEPLPDQTPDDDKRRDVTRLVFSIFLVMFICVGIMYTMYLVVRCMRYVRAARRLEERRRSVIHASQIIFE
jgi:lysylphosphatidylglycerol synthetase-like protein (DUF2156 family)